MWHWLTRRTNHPVQIKVPPALRLEALEAREVPAVLIQIDYSLDTGFFTNNPAARAVMEQAAADLGNSISANLAAITPSGSNTWTATFFNPATGAPVSVPNMTIGANTIRVFVGAGVLADGRIGLGTAGGVSASGTSDWVNVPQTRGWGGFATWGGDIEFDSRQNWYFGQTTDGLTSSQYDFYSVARHELGRSLGIGTSSQWFGLSSGGTFHGSNAASVYGGPVPETSGYSGWAAGVTVNGQQASMDPAISPGVRVNWTALDAAALRDLGWGGAAPGGVAPPPATPTPTSAAALAASTPAPAPAARPASPALSFTSASGTLTAFAVVNGTLVPTGQTFTPFPGYRGELRVAAGDFNGDGVADYAITTGAGSPSVIEIVNGRDGTYLVPPTAPFGSYSGGLSLAAGDINHSGRDQLVIAGDGAPPVVLVFQVSGGGLHLQTGFMAFDAPWFTGGIRVAVGDLNRDGYADVVVGTASQVGAVAAYSGAGLAHGVTTELFPRLVPLPGSTSGLNVAVGDFNADGYADLAVSFAAGGPGVLAMWSGAVLTQSDGRPGNQLPVMATFLTPPDLTGAQLAAIDAGDGRAELVAAGGSPGSVVHAFDIE